MSMAPDLIARWPAFQLADRSRRLERGFRLAPGELADAIGITVDAASTAQALWRRDPSAWSSDPAVQGKIAQRLGWLDSPGLMAGALDRLHTCARDARRDGFTDVVLLGMGGSSLAPEVLRSILGSSVDALRLHMLDSTDPAAILAVDTPPAHTLYIFASKSGTTIEPSSLFAHFRQRLEHAGLNNWSRHFIAITDEGTELDRLARTEHFRDVFINPSDIGGRYSALSYFGLVPAALMGQDIAGLVGWGLAMLASSAPGDVDQRSPRQTDAVTLGLAMAAGARSGRDKLTLILPPELEAFGLWVEQLVAESTGKHGVGVVPIAGETPGAADGYDNDRLLVRLRLDGTDSHNDRLIADLRARGTPFADIVLPEATALGAEFVRWEIATAIAGAALSINPFDEPNVSQAKDATRTLLGQFGREGRLPTPAADDTILDDVTLTLSAAARERLPVGSATGVLSLLGAGDYFALLAYLGPDPELASALHAFRMAVRDRARVATMFGYGPRYLHSTGQLHKGGANTGVFVVISSQASVDLPIPGEAFSFGTLELAQAFGDFQSLDATGRRALLVHLPRPDAALLRSVVVRLMGILNS